jgi:hypothetical protein
MDTGWVGLAGSATMRRVWTMLVKASPAVSKSMLYAVTCPADRRARRDLLYAVTCFTPWPVTRLFGLYGHMGLETVASSRHGRRAAESAL